MALLVCMCNQWFAPGDLRTARANSGPRGVNSGPHSFYGPRLTRYVH